MNDLDLRPLRLSFSKAALCSIVAAARLSVRLRLTSFQPFLPGASFFAMFLGWTLTGIGHCLNWQVRLWRVLRGRRVQLAVFRFTLNRFFSLSGQRSKTRAMISCFDSFDIFSSLTRSNVLSLQVPSSFGGSRDLNSVSTPQRALTTG